MLPLHSQATAEMMRTTMPQTPTQNKRPTRRSATRRTRGRHPRRSFGAAASAELFELRLGAHAKRCESLCQKISSRRWSVFLTSLKHKRSHLEHHMTANVCCAGLYRCCTPVQVMYKWVVSESCSELSSCVHVRVNSDGKRTCTLL